MRFTKSGATALAVGAAVTTSFLSTAAPAARADEAALREEMTRRLAEMEARHRKEIDDLRREFAATRDAAVSQPSAPSPSPSPPAPTALQEQIDRLADDVDAMKSKLPASAAPKGAFRLMDLSFNTLVTAGASTAPEDVIQTLQAGGHDPKKRGFTLPNVELTLSGAVDPYFTAQANVVTLLSPEGETEVELEEAWAATTALPAGFQIKAGQFFTQFGRHNPQHAHAWDFVDVPVVSGRILGGDGMRGPGVQASWLGPDAFPVELTAALQNANGETMASFLSEEPPVGAPATRSVRTFQDVTATARAALSFDATDEIPLLFGVSAASGPSGASDSGDARILGADVTAKWKPLDAHAGFPFVSFRAEWIGRHFEYDTPGGLAQLEDSGWYAQTTWGFARDWTIGARYDRFGGTDDTVPGLDDRSRWSAALTFHTSEFAKIRLQVNRDRADALDDDVTSVWLQFEFNLGTHGAHKF